MLWKLDKTLVLPAEVGGGGERHTTFRARVAVENGAPSWRPGLLVLCAREWLGSVLANSETFARSLGKSTSTREGEEGGGGEERRMPPGHSTLLEGVRAKELGEGVAKGIFCSGTFIATLQEKSKPDLTSCLPFQWKSLSPLPNPQDEHIYV